MPERFSPMSANLRPLITARTEDMIRRAIEEAKAFQQSPAYAEAIREIVAAGRRAERASRIDPSAGKFRR